MAACDPILQYIKPGWTGVEIGVRFGESAQALLEFGVGLLCLIDPWENYDGYPERANPDGCERTLARLDAWKDRLVVYRMMSEAAALLVPEVDFVWIDGNHCYGYVKRDLELYWPKARHVLAGHDYCNVGDCEVKRAVDEFAAAHGLTVSTSGDCWVILK